MLVTHDMGVIAETSDRVAVMYSGRIAEIGPVLDVVQNPLHPYAKGLMGAIPTLASDTDRLVQIPGSMPRLSAIPPGCPFNPRCAFVFDRCRVERPEPIRRGTQAVACHLYDTAATETDHTAFSPRAGINVRLIGTARQEGHAYLAVGRSFKAATPDQLYDQRAIPVPFPPYGITISNPLLRPQRGTSVAATNNTASPTRAPRSRGSLSRAITIDQDTRAAHRDSRTNAAPQRAETAGRLGRRHVTVATAHTRPSPPVLVTRVTATERPARITSAVNTRSWSTEAGRK
jgi:oligopeptide/dipeptide ABC transporter ATP-binding protein